MSVEALKEILAPQIEAGLQSIRLTVLHKPGVSGEAVMRELLAAEQAIATGNLSDPPGPDSN